MKLFGFNNKPKEDPKQTIKNLNYSIELLTKRQEFLQFKINKEIEYAKKNGKTNKKMALIALKRKGTYEKEIESLYGSIFNIEQQKLSIESTLMNKAVFESMKQGGNTLKEIHKDMNIDDVEDNTDDIREQLEVANEIGQTISQDVTNGLYDDDELEKELEDIALEDLTYPTVVTNKPPNNNHNKPLTNKEIDKNKEKEMIPN